MSTESSLLAAIADDPADPVIWRVLGDWLEEQGEADRAELARLSLRLRLERDHGLSRIRAKPCETGEGDLAFVGIASFKHLEDRGDRRLEISEGLTDGQALSIDVRNTEYRSDNGLPQNFVGVRVLALEIGQD